MSGWNAMSYDGKDNLLGVVREQADLLFAMAEAPRRSGRRSGPG